MPSDIYNPMEDLHEALRNATKIYCSCLSEVYDDSNSRWSPDLPKYMFDHPDKCEETMRIIGSEEYNDPYYDEGFRQLFHKPSGQGEGNEDGG
jgi:hypothetical protein